MKEQCKRNILMRMMNLLKGTKMTMMRKLMMEWNGRLMPFVEATQKRIKEQLSLATIMLWRNHNTLIFNLFIIDNGDLFHKFWLNCLSLPNFYFLQILLFIASLCLNFHKLSTNSCFISFRCTICNGAHSKFDNFYRHG